LLVFPLFLTFKASILSIIKKKKANNVNIAKNKSIK